ncbi:MAG: hypothetical protein ACO3JL_15590, partial [Myxococcota bacterium]
WVSTTPGRTWVMRTAEGTFKDEDRDDLAAVHRARVREALATWAERRRDDTAARDTSRWVLDTSSSVSRGALPVVRPATSWETPQSRAGIGDATHFGGLRPVGQVGLTYLVLDGPNGMVVVDQHAAHERITFERLRAAVRTNAPSTQPLLFPLQVSLSPLEDAALVDHGPALARYGLDVEPFGAGSAMIRAVPFGLDAGKAEAIVRDTLAELAEGGGPDALEELTDKVCARLACHGSVRAGQHLSNDEVRALLRQLDEIDLGAHCPHGRPVVRSLPFDEMARWFDRR